MDAALVFNGITPARFDAICARAQRATGIAIKGLNGTAQRDTPLGVVEILWSCNPQTDMLTLQCLRRPPFTLGKIESGLRDLVEGTND